MEYQKGLSLRSREKKSWLGRLWRPLGLYAAAFFWIYDISGLAPSYIALGLGLALVSAMCVVAPYAKTSAAALLTGVGMVCLWPAARGGCAMLLNGLFRQSQDRNTYIYNMLAEPQDNTKLCLVAAGLTIALVLAAFCQMAARGTYLWATGGMAAAVIVQIYFGVTAGMWAGLGLFAMLAFALMPKGGNIAPAAALAASGMVILAALSLFWPEVDSRLEEYSEGLRDRLAVAAQSAMASQRGSHSQETLETRRENRLDLEQGGDGAGDSLAMRGFNRIEQYIRSITRPLRTDYFGVVMIFLMILLLLCLPFAPFIFIDRRRRRAISMRQGFDDPSSAMAIRRIFPFIIKWLRWRTGVEGRFDLYVQMPWEDMPQGYGKRLEGALSLWNEAEYSSHEMTEEERMVLLGLLSETEQAIYSRAGMWQRFRLKYIDCLAV